MTENALIIEGHDWRHEHAAMAAVWMHIFTTANDVGDPDYICGFPGRHQIRPGIDHDFFVVADLLLADGTSVIGTLAPRRDDSGEFVYTLAACFWPDGRAAHAHIHAADDHPADPPQLRDSTRRRDKGRDWLLKILSRTHDAVFPINVTPRVQIIGWQRSWSVADVLPGRGMAWTTRERPPERSTLP